MNFGRLSPQQRTETRPVSISKGPDSFQVYSKTDGQRPRQGEDAFTSLSRRGAMLMIGSSIAGLGLTPRHLAWAELPETAVYKDEVDGFSITIPQGWNIGTGELGASQSNRFSNASGLQRVVGWTPAGQPGGSSDMSNTSIAITVKTPGADYTGLGSFGTAQDFGEKLVASIDRSFMARAWGRKANEPVITASLVSAKEQGGKYLIEYITGKSGEATRHVWTVVCFGENGKGLRRFYTVTGSCTDSAAPELGELLESTVSSFKP